MIPPWLLSLERLVPSSSARPTSRSGPTIARTTALMAGLPMADRLKLLTTLTKTPVVLPVAQVFLLRWVWLSLLLALR